MPLESSKVKQLAQSRTLNEEIKLILPLEQFLVKELVLVQYNVVLEGVFKPLPSWEGLAKAPRVKQAAYAMCRLLIGSKFGFDSMHKISQQGYQTLEQALRTAFLPKLSGQESPVVDQVGLFFLQVMSRNFKAGINLTF